MGRILAAAAALSFMLSPHIFATDMPFQGSTVIIPALVTKNPTATIQQPKVLRLPPQAGKVKYIVTTNLLAKGTSWVAFGHQYISFETCIVLRKFVGGDFLRNCYKSQEHAVQECDKIGQTGYGT